MTWATGELLDAFSSAAVASSFSALRPAMATGNPPAAKRRAMAAPSPWLAPTPTTRTLPWTA